MNKSLEEMVSLPEFFLELSAAPLTALLVCLLMVTIQAHSRQRCVTKAQDSIIYPRTIPAFALASVTQHGLIMLYPLRETLLSVKPRAVIPGCPGTSPGGVLLGSCSIGANDMLLYMSQLLFAMQSMAEASGNAAPRLSKEM